MPCHDWSLRASPRVFSLSSGLILSRAELPNGVHSLPSEGIPEPHTFPIGARYEIPRFDSRSLKGLTRLHDYSLPESPSRSRGSPEATRVVSRKPVEVSLPSSGGNRLAKAEATRCGKWLVRAIELWCAWGIILITREPRDSHRDVMVATASESLTSVVVRTTVRPRNKSGSALSDPCFSDPARGCPPTKLSPEGNRPSSRECNHRLAAYVAENSSFGDML